MAFLSEVHRVKHAVRHVVLLLFRVLEHFIYDFFVNLDFCWIDPRQYFFLFFADVMSSVQVVYFFAEHAIDADPGLGSLHYHRGIFSFGGFRVVG